MEKCINNKMILFRIKKRKITTKEKSLEGLAPGIEILKLFAQLHLKRSTAFLSDAF